MSRMLNALRQIHSRCLWPDSIPIRPVATAELVELGLRTPESAPPVNRPENEAPCHQNYSARTDHPLRQDDPESKSRAHSADDHFPDECHRVYSELAEKVLSQLPSSPSVIVFTSPTHFAGQTEMLISLATALASGVQSNVVLVDANADRPDFDDVPDIEVEWEKGAAGWPAPVFPTSQEGLSVMPFGPAARNNGRSMQRGTLSKLMGQLRSHCRLAVVSAPPLCRDEAILLARLCDGACLVVELGRTPRRAAERAVNTLDTAGARLLGCVVADGQPE